MALHTIAMNSLVSGQFAGMTVRALVGRAGPVYRFATATVILAMASSAALTRPGGPSDSSEVVDLCAHPVGSGTGNVTFAGPVGYGGVGGTSRGGGACAILSCSDRDNARGGLVASTITVNRGD